MDASPDVDTDLLRFVSNGEHQRAATLLVDRYGDDVYGVCRAMVGDSAVAEDLSEQVFARAFVTLPAFTGERSARGWLLQLTRERCMDHLHSEQPGPWTDEASSDKQAAGDDRLPPGMLNSREDAQRALGCLIESERALVVLRFGHGLEHAELADAFGLRENTVRGRLSGAVAKMRDALALSSEPTEPRRRSLPPMPAAARTGADRTTDPAPPPSFRPELDANDTDPPDVAEPREIPSDAPDTDPPARRVSAAPPPPPTTASPLPGLAAPRVPSPSPGAQTEYLDWGDEESLTPTLLNATRARLLSEHPPAPDSGVRESWWQTLLGTATRPSAPPPPLRFEAPPALRTRLLDRARAR